MEADRRNGRDDTFANNGVVHSVERVPLGTRSSEIWLTGTIENNRGDPLSGADISVSSRDVEYAYVTDKTGQYRFSSFQVGDPVSVNVSAVGYVSQQRDSVISPQTIENFVLDQSLRLGLTVVSEATNGPIQNPRVTVAAGPENTTPIIERDATTQKTIISHLVEGDWDFQIAAHEHISKEVRGIRLSDDVVDQQLHVHLARRGSLEGFVVDAESGQPVEGVRLAPVSSNMLRNSFSVVSDYQDSVATNADGWFQMNNLSVGEAELKLIAEGYVSSYEEIQIEENSVETFSLFKGSRIIGTIADSDGKPPSSGRVWLIEKRTGFGLEQSIDPDGSFEFETVGPGIYSVSGETSRGSTEESALTVYENSGPHELRLGIRSGKIIRGKIVDDLLDRETGAFVSIWAASNRVDGSYVDDAGQFEFLGVPNDLITVVATAQDGRKTFREVDLTGSKEKYVQLSFVGSNVLSGFVRKGVKGIEGISVSAYFHSAIRPEMVVQTRENGKYEMKGLAEGNYRIEVQRIEKYVTIPGVSKQDFSLPNCVFKGTVVDSDSGYGLKDALVSAKPGDAKPNIPTVLETTTDYFGRFEFDSLKCGQHFLFVYAAGYEFGSSPVTATSDSSSRFKVAMTKGSDKFLSVLTTVSRLPLQFVDVVVHDIIVGETKIRLTLDSEGRGDIPNNLKGKDLSFSYYGSQPTVVRSWDGNDLYVEVEVQR